ncbi:PIN domain-containing protein [Candidatus Woesearchaeota archaeon]|nr:PIN domain-containing protein [Candidatus Woesearchaeota archaeon]
MTYALDTCFLVWLFENHKENNLLKWDYVITSFNYEELMHIEHRHKVGPHIKNSVRKFEKKNKLNIVPVPVSPGHRLEEISYISDVNPKILNYIKDPSDAVLAAFCTQKNYDLVTRDKHDIYKASNENFFDFKILKTIKN